MAEKKRPTPTDDPDWTPGSSQPPKKRKEATGARSSAESSMDKERRRLQHVLQQVSGEKVAAKLLKHLSSGRANAALVTSLGIVFNKPTYPPPPNKLSTCTRCGKPYDPKYNSLDYCKNVCKVEHQVTRGCRSGGTTWWECDKCGQQWVREWDDPMDGDGNEIGWCYEGPHHDSDTEDDTD